jgi:hypothetical protein
VSPSSTYCAGEEVRAIAEHHTLPHLLATVDFEDGAALALFLARDDLYLVPAHKLPGPHRRGHRLRDPPRLFACCRCMASAAGTRASDMLGVWRSAGCGRSPRRRPAASHRRRFGGNQGQHVWRVRGTAWGVLEMPRVSRTTQPWVGKGADRGAQPTASSPSPRGPPCLLLPARSSSRLVPHHPQ